MALYLAVRLFYSLGIFYLPYELISSLWACFRPLKRLYFCIFAYNGIKPGISRYFLSNFAKFSPIIAPPSCVYLCVFFCVYCTKTQLRIALPALAHCTKGYLHRVAIPPRLVSARNIRSAGYVKVIGAAPGLYSPPLLGYL